ncbi:GDYXXLXY domain-containing protein [Nocardioides sp.]|uniref:GDYXXLXY domain-containing protein n=1 Tax=Nocardioides sp. TaxID=35761 RepID=UPI003564F00F
MSTVTSSRPVRVVGAVLVMLVLVGVAVAGQLSARLTGDEYTFRVAPVDPIDPFRGAYVELAYPDLQELERWEASDDVDIEGARGELFVTLREEGGVWVADDYTRERPDTGPYLACNDRDWRIRCGIESWFLPQAKAQAAQDAVNAGDSIATVRIDGRGNAALIEVTVP